MDGNPLEILLVESSEGDARLFGQFLTRRWPAVRIKWVREMWSALDVLAKQPVDAVMLDPELPDASDLQALARMHRRASNVPIVVLAQHGDKAQGLRAIQMGAQDYLVKDFVTDNSLVRSMQYAIERKRLANSVRQRDAEIAHLSPLIAMGEIVSNLAHELSQPLTAIKNYVEASIQRLVADRKGAKQRMLENLAAMHQQACHGGEILSYMKNIAARPHLSPQHVCLSEVICKSLSLLDLEVRRADVDVVLQLDAKLPPIWADKTQLEQVVLNLVRNALEAIVVSGSSRREICLWTTPDRPAEVGDRAAVRVSVADTGCGFNEAIEERMFEPFLTTKKDNLGVGLAICRTIVEAHEGRIEARRNAHGGATFTILLPATCQQSRSSLAQGIDPLSTPVSSECLL